MTKTSSNPEADDLGPAFKLLAASGEPFNRWFGDQVRGHGSIAWATLPAPGESTISEHPGFLLSGIGRKQSNLTDAEADPLMD